MNRVTAQDVAQAAGVSLATVDRVLNNRKGVRQATIERVYAAMDELNFMRDETAANLARRKFYTFTFVVPSGDNSFMTQLREEIEGAKTAFASQRIDINMLNAPALEPQQLVKAIDAMGDSVGDGIALVATEDRLVRDAINRLRNRGVHVVTLISDLPSSRREHFVGIDNVAAGRVAASLLNRFIETPEGEVAIVAGSSILRDHVERRLGFEQVMRAECPNIKMLPWIEGLEDPEIVEEKLTTLLKSNPKIVAVYSLGGGNRGVISALQSSGRPIRAITHELTDHTRTALMHGDLDAVLAQDPAQEVRSAIRVLKAFADKKQIDHSQEQIRLEIFVRDNLP